MSDAPFTEPGSVDTAPVAAAVPLAPTVAAAALAAAAAAWVGGGVFRDPAARGIGVLGVLVVVGLVALGQVLRRPLLAQVLALPTSALVGALLVLPDARGGSATLPGLVVDAVRSGGLLQPPIPLDPGWRFILVVLAALVTSTSIALALGTNRPRLAILPPGLVLVAAALVQPDTAELLSALGGIVLLVASLAAAYGSQLRGEGGLGRDFELNRVLRGGALAIALVVAVGVLSRTGVLFPQPNRSHVSPPQKPQAAPPQADRVLFTVRLDNPDLRPTYREGVIDVYQESGSGGAWFLPAFDSRTLRDLQPPAALPDRPTSPPAGTYSATFTMADAEGHGLPTVAGAERISGSAPTLQFNPATGAIQVRDRPVFKGLTYSLTAALPPAGTDLQPAAGVPESIRPFLKAPPQPSEVVTLLAAAPAAPFARLQFVRTALYQHVVAAGEGRPVDVSPGRVAEMLDGKEASPYEITAAEALLARWAGIPARIAFGYYGGTPQPDGGVAIRPANGATWLETYFRGYGWVPIVGLPPKAKASFNLSTKNPNPGVQPADNLGLVVYVPVEVRTFYRFYQVARFYLLLALPWALLLGLAAFGYPALLKGLRTFIRRRWALRHGPRGRVAVAYAEFRDAANDLNVGDAQATPLNFLASIEPDAEHRDLAWLVTRAIWGDLRRDLGEADAQVAEDLAASTTRRLSRAQGGGTRLLALVSRASLREPFSREIPNAWPSRGRRRPIPTGRRRRRLPGLAMLIGMVALAAMEPRQAIAAPTVTDLRTLLPASLPGLELRPEPAAAKAYRQAGAVVRDGQVYTIRHDDTIEGSVQLSFFRADVRPSNEVVHQLEANIGSGRFRPMEVAQYLYDGHCFCAGGYHDARVDELAQYAYQKIFVMVLPDQRVYMWFPGRERVLALVVVRSQFTIAASDAFVLDLVDFEHGRGLAPVPVPAPNPLAVPVPSPNAGVSP